ncbi:MAG: GntR family transcriptional regulator [Clostridia bacterium]|nr:GntR family transcriptional regulator [Clostridia bacterium]
MQYDANAPIWLQVMSSLELDMVTGKRPPGEKLPGGRDLAVQYGINPNTASRVYQELERKGLCETRRGLGTFVTTDGARLEGLRREMAQRAVSQFLSSMDHLGISRTEAARMILEEEKICQT